MKYFERCGNDLVWRNRGETLVISPWGQNSLRVRSTLQGDVLDTRFALLDPEETDVEIVIEDERASIRCGNLTAEVGMDDWHGMSGSLSAIRRAKCFCGRRMLRMRSICAAAILSPIWAATLP